MGDIFTRTFSQMTSQAYPRVNNIRPLKTIDPIRIQSVPHRKHYVSATKPNRLMLFRETVAVYCENHTEHTDTLWAEYIAIQSVPHRKHITSTLQSQTG
jgi:hypothetical protein